MREGDVLLHPEAPDLTLSADLTREETVSTSEVMDATEVGFLEYLTY